MRRSAGLSPRSAVSLRDRLQPSRRGRTATHLSVSATVLLGLFPRAMLSGGDPRVMLRPPFRFAARFRLLGT